jgi:hypothetical protein
MEEGDRHWLGACLRKLGARGLASQAGHVPVTLGMRMKKAVREGLELSDSMICDIIHGRVSGVVLCVARIAKRLWSLKAIVELQVRSQAGRWT